MTELGLHNFIHHTASADMRWDGDVLSAWIDHYNIAEFADFIGSYLEYDGGGPCNLRSDGSIWLDLVPVCGHYGIDPERIFPKPTQ